ncbi:hypothetical protein F8M41_007745 [Gigaspora margarita]|uniref:Uncharacterized protein n=1 Tax=Gigaspora margarita TaxID=4874 RepID=A0A8H3X4G9_GIGMA|nr:hypothetical protein F8M41_007745 [Gigaspora margarita]
MIQDQWPAIVEIHFTSLGKALDPYSLEVFEGNSNEGFKIFQDGSEVGTVSLNEQYREKSLLPEIVNLSFTTSHKVLDPYALETCEYKLIYFENFEGQIERRCKRAFEDDFYMVSKVSGSTYLGLQFTLCDDNSKLFTWISAVYYCPSPRIRDVQ